MQKNRIALIIGNADYSSRSLINPVNDAEDVAEVLRLSGFDISLITDANQEEMEPAIQAFGEKLQPDSVGLFYFSGHGVQYQGANYLIPVDAISRVYVPGHLRLRTVDVGYVLEVMKERGSELNIVVLDACRDNPFKGFSRGLEKGLARISRSEGTLIAYATSPGKIALDGTDKNSPYTKQLVRHIRESDQPIELMLKEISREVKFDTHGQQLPWYEASIEGDFRFRQPRTGAENGPSAIPPGFPDPDKDVPDLPTTQTQASSGDGISEPGVPPAPKSSWWMDNPWWKELSSAGKPLGIAALLALAGSGVMVLEPTFRSPHRGECSGNVSIRVIYAGSSSH